MIKENLSEKIDEKESVRILSIELDDCFELASNTSNVILISSKLHSGTVNDLTKKFEKLCIN